MLHNISSPNQLSGFGQEAKICKIINKKHTVTDTVDFLFYVNTFKFHDSTVLHQIAGMLIVNAKFFIKVLFSFHLSVNKMGF